MKTIENCPIQLHESLGTSVHCAGRQTATIHLVCLTRGNNPRMLVKKNASDIWVLPKRTMPLVGALISFPNEIITKEMKGDVEYMRGSNPSCSDTKVLGQYDGGHLHIFLRVFISETKRQNWAYVEGLQCLDALSECDEMVASAMRHLKMGVEKIPMAA